MLPAILLFIFLLQVLEAFSSADQIKMFGRFFKTTAPATTVAEGTLTTGPTCTGFEDKFKGSLFGLYVADATAMPVHWMYNLNQLKRDYGKIKGFTKPKDNFEGSIMNLSNTGGGGRGSDQGDIVGSVILHGKKKYWLRGGNYHYHLGLEAGENTLEAQLTRVLVQSIIDNGAPSAPTFSATHFLERYMTFMQTAGSHNDTYASTAHRMFFANVVRGKAPDQCADNDGHNTDAIDALTLTVPVILAYSQADRGVRNAKVREAILATRKTKAVLPYAEQYADILTAVLHGTPLREAIDQHDPQGSVRRTAQSVSPDPMVACYIDSAYPAMLVFAYRYADSLEAGILASANAGGENVARGSLLGALLGAQHGMSAFPAWTHQLKNHNDVLGEIDQLFTVSVGEESK